MTKPACLVCSEPTIKHHRGLMAVGVIVGLATERDFSKEGKWHGPDLVYDRHLQLAAIEDKIAHMLQGWIIDGKLPKNIKGGAINLENKKEWYVRLVDYPANSPEAHLIYCYKVVGPDTVPRDIRTQATPAKLKEYNRQLAEELPAILQAGDLAQKIGKDLGIDIVPVEAYVSQKITARIEDRLNYEARDIYSKGRGGAGIG